MRRLFLCFGSRSEGDALAWEICDLLGGKIKGTDFVKCANPFEIADRIKSREDRSVVIIDAVKCLKKAKVFSGAAAFAKTKSVTTHDLDLCTVLKLMEAVEKRKFRIIGVPFGTEKGKVSKEVKKIISSLSN